jgi:hypothetical protein
MEVEGWESITEELLLKVLEDGLGWAREASCAVRLVSRRWRNVHDGGCKAAGASLSSHYDTLYASLTDEELVMVCERLPALTSLNLSCCYQVTDEGLAAAVSRLPRLTSLNLSFCYWLTDDAVRAVSSLPALTSLDLRCCITVTDEGLLAVSSLPALVHLNLHCCYSARVTAAGVQALRNTTAAPNLHIIH